MATGGDFEDALKSAGNGGLMGLGAGFVSGTGHGYSDAKATGLNPWTGRPKNDLTAKDIGVHKTMERILKGEKYPHDNDNTVFHNHKNILPEQPEGYYKEYVHPTNGKIGAGAQRIVMGQGGDAWYTPDHYKTFIKIEY